MLSHLCKANCPTRSRLVVSIAKVSKVRILVALNPSLFPNCDLNIFLLLGFIDDVSATRFVIFWYQAFDMMGEYEFERRCIQSNMDSCFLFVCYTLCLYHHSPYSHCFRK